VLASSRLSLLGPNDSDVTITHEDDEVEVLATGRMKTTMLAIPGIGDIPVFARAKAAAYMAIGSTPAGVSADSPRLSRCLASRSANFADATGSVRPRR
jgi:hypothetical protein